jgi:SAM-dependent methyltransferase
MRAIRQAQSTKWRSSSRKKKARHAEDWVLKLEPLRQVRAPFLACHRELLRGVFETHLPPHGTVVEFGAGLGQLSEWSLESEAPTWVHTDPDQAALSAHERRFPTRRVALASAERLPFETGSCSAVVGLCVLDLVADLDAALREIRRVLAPGGLLLHLLDMTPVLDGLFSELSVQGGVALPNLFSDPSEARFPEDLLVTDQVAMRRLLAPLAEQGHPLPRAFGHYFAAFEAKPFDAAGTARWYDSLARTPEMRELLRVTLSSAYAVGFKLGVPPPRGTLTSSCRHFSERLARAASRVAFEVVENEVRTAWSHAERHGEDPGYRSLALGHERRAPEPPARLLCSDAPLPAAGMALLEAGMHVFAARPS